MTKHGLSARERLEIYSMAEPNTGCLLWVGTVNEFGYPLLTWAGKQGYRAHRLAYETVYGSIPDGMHVLHRCDVKSCVNPDHLFVGTNADNVRDKVAKSRQARGTSFKSAKLTDADVLAIRASSLSSREIARKYGIGKTTAHLVKSGQTWRHLS